MKLSIAIATFNEQENITECLESVKSWADEIVVVDGGSQDKTLDRVKKFDARIISSDNPEIFHINKQKAVDACRGDWILQLDADEVIPDKLRKEILEIIEQNNNSNAGYYIPRKNYFLGHWLRKGGLYPDYVIRLFRNKMGMFPCKSVHEQIRIDGSVGHLKNPMIHNTAPTLKEYWVKASRYISLRSLELSKERIPKSVGNMLKFYIVKPADILLVRAFRHKGILDGWRGLLFAVLSAVQEPLAYNSYLKNT